MSLFSSINLAKHSLVAAQVGLQVTGNNIANANTPDYIREQVVYQPGVTQRIGSLLLGTGVDIAGIVQQVDRFLLERLRTASGDLANSEAQENTYLQLEAVLAELGDTDLSTSLTTFFGSIHDVLNQPESEAVRNLAVLRGSALADDIRRMDSRVRRIRSETNDRIVASVADINRLLEEIADLNLKIVSTEGGGLLTSDAVGLRDQRERALSELSKLLDVRIVEQESGSANVFMNGEYLVIDATHRGLEAAFKTDRGLNVATLHIDETDSLIQPGGGEVAGLFAARDEILAGFLDQFDEFAGALAFEFNKVFSTGQGLTGYEQLTSIGAVNDVDAALDQAGLAFTPTNGVFQVLVRNKLTGLTETADVFIDLNGLDGDDTTLNDLTAALNGVDGISASITQKGSLSITTDSPSFEFAFNDDTSGVLAALGLNTFFTGSTASDIRVNSVVRADPSKFAASRSGIGQNTDNALVLANFLNAPLESQNGVSLIGMYEELTSGVAQSASATRAVAEGFRVFKRTVEGQHLGVSGVSIDEEAIKMITFQRAFQASARFIATIDELLETLVNL